MLKRGAGSSAVGHKRALFRWLLREGNSLGDASRRLRSPGAFSGAWGVAPEAMVTRRALLSLFLASLGLGLLAGRARAQTITQANAHKYLRIEFQSGLDRRGQPTVWGYIYNERGLGNARVQILIESLDASGKPIAQEVDYVDSEVVLFGSRYFEARPKTPGASYRVTVHSGDWTRGT